MEALPNTLETHVYADRFGPRPFLQMLDSGVQLIMGEIEFEEEGLKRTFPKILIDGLLKQFFVGLNNTFELV